MKANKLTTKSQEAINDAINLAEENGNPAVDGIHLLVALLKQGDGLVNPTLEKAGVNLNGLQSDAEKELEKEPKVSGSSKNGTVTSSLKKVFDQAEKEAAQLSDDFTSTEHLLLGLIEVSTSAQKVLKKYNVTVDSVKKALVSIRGTQRVTDENPESKF